MLLSEENLYHGTSPWWEHFMVCAPHYHPLLVDTSFLAVNNLVFSPLKIAHENLAHPIDSITFGHSYGKCCFSHTLTLSLTDTLTHRRTHSVLWYIAWLILSPVSSRADVLVKPSQRTSCCWWCHRFRNVPFHSSSAPLRVQPDNGMKVKKKTALYLSNTRVCYF